MRDAQRIQLTPGQYHDAKVVEREKTLELLLVDLRRAREAAAEWYEWIRNGQPALSQAEYDQVGKFGKKRR